MLIFLRSCRIAPRSKPVFVASKWLKYFIDMRIRVVDPAMKVINMKMKLSLLFSLVLVMQASTPLLQTVNAQAEAGRAIVGRARDGATLASDDPARVTSSPLAAATSGEAVAAIIELEGEPLAERVRSLRGGASGAGSFSTLSRRDRRVDYQSAEALEYEAQISREQEDFQSRAALISPNIQVRTRLKAVANAVSVEAPAKDIAAIAALPGVRHVEFVKRMHAALDASVSLIGAPAIWDRLGGSSSAGAGIKIAILDTGIDITNPMFSDAGFTAPAGFPLSNNNSGSLVNNKVIVAKSFLSANSAGKRTAEDEEGHGSNVAGIAAGNFGTASPLGSISGVAPRAWLGNYRVLDSEGGGFSDFIAQALEEAERDGFDIANLSLGTEAGSSLDFLARSVETVVARGMIVVAAAGNDGNGGNGDQMSVHTPGIAPSAITVAATTNSHLVGARISVTGPGPIPSDLESIIMIPGEGGPALDGSFQSLPLVDVSALDGGQGKACSSLTANSLTGKIALIERGTCPFVQKVNAAAGAGAKGVIVFNADASAGVDNPGEELVRMDVTDTLISSVFVARSNGLALRSFVRSHADSTVSLKPVASISSASDVIAPFSSRGPSTLETLKPDIAAPGTFIYSADLRSVSANGFSPISGTSQASPHVAGAAALVLQLHPAWAPAEVKSALMSSASADVFATSNKTDRTGPLAMGAGRVDLARAAAVTATFSSENGTASISFGINKLKKKAVSLKQNLVIKNAGDGQNSYTFSIQQFDPGDGVVVSLLTPVTVSLASGQSETVQLGIAAAKSAKKRDYSGLVIVTDSLGQAFHVPYWVRFVKKK
jgi:minor extracellular serine protease Vpr